MVRLQERTGLSVLASILKYTELSVNRSGICRDRAISRMPLLTPAMCIPSLWMPSQTRCDHATPIVGIKHADACWTIAAFSSAVTALTSKPVKERQKSKLSSILYVFLQLWTLCCLARSCRGRNQVLKFSTSVLTAHELRYILYQRDDITADSADIAHFLCVKLTLP